MLGFFRRERIQDISPTRSLQELKKRVKIVVVDDQEASFPTSLLKDDGYTIDWWPRLDARHLQMLENGDYDIIILDILDITDASVSDTGDGLGVLQRLKAVNPQQVVVAFSANSYDLSKVPFWRLADDALRKPVSIITCKELLDRLIQDRVSVPQYWKNIEDLLQKANVAPKKIHKLERELVKATRKDRSLSVDEVKGIVGAVEVVGIVAELAHKILILCKIMAP